jgi:4-oxalocrotonate tautomerase
VKKVPTITIEGPPVRDLEKRRAFAGKATDAAAEMYGLSKDIITVVIRENAPENVAVGGRLLIDRREPT